MRRIAQLSLTALVSFALFAGCANREVARVDPTQAKEEFKDIPVELNRDIDLLFVIDNSGSMSEEQQSLTANFQLFINVLENIEGGLPNVHIGVVSTDVGVGPNNGGTGCSANGDNGGLRTNPACGVSNAYIIDTEDGGAGRNQNYDSGANSLAETFSCMAGLGINGCGFEQPLESIKRALDRSNPANSGFLRENAFLAVVIVSDEDDCSVSDTNMFDTTQNDISAPLGPLSSFRCFEFGVACEPDDPRTPGPRQNCLPRDDSQYMTPVQQYIDFLKGVKQDPNQIIVAGIIGNPTPVTVGIDSENNIPKLAPSCTSASGEAAPAVRLQTFLDGFPQRNTVTTICNDNLTDALVQIAELLKKVVGNPCLEGDIDTDPEAAGVQYDCQVMDVRYPGTDDETQSVIPNCTTSGGAQPCWRIEPNPSQCAGTPSEMELLIDRPGDNVPTGTHVQARCVVL